MSSVCHVFKLHVLASIIPNFPVNPESGTRLSARSQPRSESHPQLPIQVSGSGEIGRFRSRKDARSICDAEIWCGLLEKVERKHPFNFIQAPPSLSDDLEHNRTLYRFDQVLSVHPQRNRSFSTPDTVPNAGDLARFILENIAPDVNTQELPFGSCILTYCYGILPLVPRLQMCRVWYLFFRREAACDGCRS